MVPNDLDANLVFRQEMLNMAADDEKAAEQIRALCSEDMLFYVNTFCWTYSPKDSEIDYPLTPFVTYDFQDTAMVEIAGCITSGRDAATPKSREMGASWMGLSVIEHLWHFRDYLSFLMVSRKESLVDDSGDPKSLFWKIDFLHKHMPRWLLPTGRWLGSKDPSRKHLHLGNADNSSVIDGEATTGNVGVGDRRTALFIDEFGAFPIADGYSVLRGSRDVTNCRIFNSTPRGQNAFYEVVTKTAAKIIRMHWTSHPLKSVGLYESNAETGQVTLLDKFRGPVELIEMGEKDIRTVMFPDEYPFVRDGKKRSPWYDAQCNRCVSPAEIGQELDIDFLGSDYQYFNPEFIEILIKKYCRAPYLRGFLEFDEETCEPNRFVEDKKHGNLFLWTQLTPSGKVASDRKFVIGTDVSAGTGASNSVSCVVDKGTGEKVGAFITPNLFPTPFASASIALAKFFNNGFMIWDASGPTGKTFTMRLTKAGYGNIYYRRNDKKIGAPISDEPGYFLNPRARETLLEDYRARLEAHQYINYSETGMKECLQFIRKNDGTIEHSASLNAQDPSGARTAHGDEAIADALASVGLAECESQPEPIEPELPVGSLAWRMKLKADAEAESKRDVLGDGW